MFQSVFKNVFDFDFRSVFTPGAIIPFDGASSAYDFTTSNGTIPFRGPNNLTFSRGTQATMYRANDGWLTFAPNNVLRNSGTSVNYIQGGTLSGLTASITGSGNENGMTYVDLTWTGTASATNAAGFYLDSNTNAAAQQGQTWTGSIYAKLINGTGSEFFIVSVHGRKSDASANEQGDFTTNVTASPVRYSATKTFTIATTVFANLAVFLSFTNGQVVNTTLRVYQPQLEQGPYAQAYNPTTGSAYYGPRLDSNPATTYYDGENLFSSSEAFSGGSFTRENATVSVAPLAPNVTVTNAWKVEEQAVLGVHRVYGATGTAITAGQYYTATVFVAPAERTWTFIQIGNGANWQDSNPGIYVNLATGQTGAINGGTKAWSVTPDGNGYWRISLTGLCILSGVTSGVLIHTAQADGTASYTGVVGSGIYAGSVSFNRGIGVSKYSYTNGTPVNGTISLGATSQGLLVEEARTNSLLWSNDFTNVAWGKTDTTITGNNTISPEGIQNAALLTEGTLGTAIISQVSQTYTANSIVTASIMLKRSNHDWIRITLRDSTGADGAQTYFNTANGALGTITLVGAGTGFSQSVQSLPNGWYRISFTGLPNATTTAAQIALASATADGVSTRVNNAARYQYGAQVEVSPTSSSNLGSSSYIPTYAAAVSRNADVLSGPASFYNQPADSVFFSYMTQGNSTNSLARAGGWRFDDGSALNDQLLLTNISGNANYNSVTASASVNINTGSPPAKLTVHKAMSAAANNDYVFYFNGANIGTATTNVRPAGITTMYIGSRGGDYLNGWVRQFAYYPSRMTNAQLQSLTT